MTDGHGKSRPRDSDMLVIVLLSYTLIRGVTECSVVPINRPSVISQ